MKKFTLVLIAALLVMAPQAYATVNYDPGTTYSTAALTGYSTFPADMAGMSVTAFFGDGSSQQAIWSNAGIASGTSWFLQEVGDTFGGTWTLSNSSGKTINSLLIDGQPGDTIFDITNPDPGTDGSARGWTFETDYTPIIATYRDLVALTGYAPVGDLYLRLNLQFTGDGFASGAVAPHTMTFIADTDMAATHGDIHPTPEPTTILLIGLGLVGLVGARRKLNK